MFWPADPRADEIHVEDLAHHLATTNRFGGSASEPYSVAQHLVLASQIVASEWRLETLLHDGAEGCTGCDLIRPVKRCGAMGVLWENFEAKNQRAVHERFGLPTKDRFVEEYRDEEFEEGETAKGSSGVINIRLQGWFLKHVMPAAVKEADNIMLMTEARDLMAPPPEPWVEAAYQPLSTKIYPWPWTIAREKFLARFHELGGK
jgi:5'-deoxynucleotidase YfbR-like HD superfamily hydrolase